MVAARTNSYMPHLERFHVFSRERLIAVVEETGFDVIHCAASGGQTAQIELHAIRKA